MPQPSVPTVAGVASPLLGALEHAWAAIRTRHPDVPDAVLVIVSGGDAKRLRLGHFAADRWQVAGAGRHEVLVGGEGLQRGPVDVLATLLHEAAHGLARARGVKDTSRQGRYHCEDQAGEVRSPQVRDEGGSKGKERALVRYPGAARRAARLSPGVPGPRRCAGRRAQAGLTSLPLACCLAVDLSTRPRGASRYHRPDRVT